jgi:hypothetical protein
MFKKTTSEIQLDAFSSPNSFLSGRSETLYDKQDAWHNLFRAQVTSRIVESICKPLFTEQTGSPNSSIRVMIAMMVIKEAYGWSDAQLFEQCRFNLLVRSALGLMNLNDAVPVESTYYLFRKKIVEHEKAGNENLFEKTFASVTKGQATDFEVNGKSIRMDSKLLGSNIAWLSRYELVHETLRLFCQDVAGSLGSHPSLDSKKGLIENILKETGNKVIYRSTNSEVKTKLQELGLLAHELILLFDPISSIHYSTLKRIFSEQFKIGDDDKTIISRDKEEISAGSVQSPHDTDCHYRNKDGNQVKGYSINVSESCDENSLNLISGADVRVVSASDNDYLQDGIKGANEVFTETVENVHTDGAYHSVVNQEFCENENIELLLNAIQGAKARFDLVQNEDGTLTVTDTQTGEIIPSTKLKDKEKWRIELNGNYRYFTTKEITASALKRKIAATPQEVLNIRNNVEATIFQLGFHYPNDKSRYRGLIKHKMWANIRCLWVNFVRIKNYMTKLNEETRLFSKFPAIGNFIAQIENKLLSIMKFFTKLDIVKPKIKFIGF